jgi:hypothetical protein
MSNHQIFDLTHNKPDLLDTSTSKNRSLWSPAALFGAVLVLMLLLAGCGGSADEAEASQVDEVSVGAAASEALPAAEASAADKAVSANEAPLPDEASSGNETPAQSSDTSASMTSTAATDAGSNASTGREAQAAAEVEIGEITFALDVTPDYEPLDAGLFFTKGITEVHAVFEYSGMSPDYTWERVWYLNDKEIARVAEAWNGPESGRFDYFVDNKGRPLPAGDWLLELYVEGELEAIGVFIIEEAGVADDGIYPLVYTRCEGDHHNIYVSDTAGSFEQLIVTRGAGPSWGPGGGAVFFYGEAGVDRQIRDGREYIFDGISNGLVAANTAPLPTTINQLNLFQSTAWKQGTARWANVSPDGSMIAFDAKPSGDYRIYFLGTDSNQQFRFEILGEQADWSPDNQQIVYRSGRDGKTGIWISNRDDTGHRLLTNNGSDSFPAWSPDGQKIAFSRDSGGGNTDIYIVTADGGNLQRLTDAAGHDTLPTFAPNGDIIFRSARNGSWGIWKMKGDGSEQTQIIANACVGNDWAFSRMDVLP